MTDTTSSGRSSPSSDDFTIVSTQTTNSTELTVFDATKDIQEAEELINSAAVELAVIDAKLEDIMNLTHPDPFAHYKCAFGFEADLSEPVHVPKNKGALCTIITEEVLAVIKIQGGLNSYIREITNGKHDFSSDFLDSETRTTTTAVAQLDDIKEHLKAVLREVSKAGHDDHDVRDDLRAAYRHAVPWIRHYRQVAVHNHVFYKVNVSHPATLSKTRTNWNSMSWLSVTS
jgi:hypothetical protein